MKDSETGWKFSLINHVLLSALGAPDKAMLVELIMRANRDGYCFPGVKRLCQARGIKHEKNFSGVGAYLPDLVHVTKRGRRRGYTLQFEAIKALPEAEVVLKRTPLLPRDPAHEEHDPAWADNTPDAPENSPAQEGANSTLDNTRDSSEDSSCASANASTQTLTSSYSSSTCSPPSPLPSYSTAQDLKDNMINDAPAQADDLENEEEADDGDFEIEWDIDWDPDATGPVSASTKLERFEDLHEGPEGQNNWCGPHKGVNGAGSKPDLNWVLEGW